MYDFFFVFFPKYLPSLIEGAIVTLQLSILSMALAIPIGLLTALGRNSGNKALEWFLAAYVEVWRDVPLIVQLLVIYFTLPQIGLTLPGFWAAILGLSLNVGAYLSEVFRAAIASIDDGQRDAGIAMGMSKTRIYTRVILPQALRIAVPTVGGYFISLLKDSSLVSFIAVNELLRNGTIIISSTFRSMEVYVMVAMVYFVLSFVASRLVRRVEIYLTPVYLRPAAKRAAAAASAATATART